MIPNEIIDTVLDRNDIVEVISNYIQLKRAGQNFKVCCPFHEEKTPSFVVSPAKQIYHCFGCGAGGNAISFLMKHEKMEFPEAIKLLADKVNIRLPQASQRDTKENTLREKLYSANNLASIFYQKSLASASGKNAYKYLAGRGIDERMIKLFRLGLAEDAWQSLMNHATSNGISEDILEKAGLILKNANTRNTYDRFRNRLMIPIFDLRNHMLGFGARSLDNSLPKYMNSPETYIYTKGKNLYGLNTAKESIRKQDYVIIVEGYFDLILPYQHGIQNVVATLGTALTIDQINALKRFTKNVIMIYDSDKAGEAAMLRGLDLLIANDMNVRMAILPKGNDPDSFVRKVGREGFMEVLKKSKDLFDYKLSILVSKFQKGEPRGKARIVEEMLPTLSRIKNTVLQSEYLKKMAEALSLDEEAIRSELKKLNKQGYTAITEIPKASYKRESKKSEYPAETTLLGIVLEDIDLMKKLEKELDINDFRSRHIQAIFKKILEGKSNGRKITPSHLISSLNDNVSEEIISEAVSMGEVVEDRERVLRDCIKCVKRERLKFTMYDLQSRMKEAEAISDSSQLNRLIAEYNKILKIVQKEEEEKSKVKQI